jgi:carbamoyl-phosphate synthase/aspartate carbamoyltransferase
MLGSSMKSVGEVMAIGRTFEEVIQKAVRMVDPSLDGLSSAPLHKHRRKYTDDTSTTSQSLQDITELESLLSRPTPLRLFAVVRALEQGYAIDRLHALTQIDRWFLEKIKKVTDLTVATRQMGSLYNIDPAMMRELKCRGFSDAAIGRLTGSDEIAVRRRRVHDMCILPYIKQIDTLAAEFPAKTNYLYTTYNAAEHDIVPDPGVIVLGNGPYCIGSSVEFDWCAVSCIRTIRKHQLRAVVVNCNPETVSTDYDESDRLYFEELTFERVLDIYEAEKARGIVVSVGGQVANCLALPLSRQGVRIYGTSPHSIDRAEDRNKFSALLDSIAVDQPEWEQAPDLEGADVFAQKVGYPVLVRPSYVLSGAAMRVAWNVNELREFLVTAADVSAEHPVVVSKFILNAKEIEFDAVAQGGQIVNYAISEHVENAGVHSGDATLILPAQRLYVETIRRVLRIAGNIAQALKITGPFNIQFISKDNAVKVIECNLRASRTFPFVSKTLQCNFIDLATRAMLDLPVCPKNIKLLDLDYVGVKAPMFSFTRLQGADPTLGVEMASTGEVACFGHDVHEAFLLSVMATGFKIPSKTKTVLFAVGPSETKVSLAPYAKVLQYLGYTIYGTEGTAEYFAKCGIAIVSVAKMSFHGAQSVVDLIRSGQIALVIDIPDSKNKSDVTIGYQIRRAAVDYGVSLVTNYNFAVMLVNSLASIKEIPCLSMQEVYDLGAATSAFSKSTVSLLGREVTSHRAVTEFTRSGKPAVNSLLLQAQLDIMAATGPLIPRGIDMTS